MAKSHLKVLIITYYWPPSSGSGVQRWMYFARYLQDHNITPVVLTVDPSKASYSKTDQSFADFVADIEVIKTKTIEPLKLYSLLTTGDSKKGIPQGNVGENKKGVFSYISRYVRGNIFIPDARLGWKKYAVNAAKNILKKKDIDLVITTGPPHSTHLIGRVLKRKYGVKWMADFRDPWTDIYYNKGLIQSKRSKKKDAILEKSVIEESDHLLVTAPSMRQLLKSKSNVITLDKIDVITNGYDSDKFDKIASKKTTDHFTISFLGLLTDAMPHQTVSNAISIIKKEKGNINIKCVLAGDISKIFLDHIKQTLGEENVDYLGYVSHNKAIELMKNADLLFTLLPAQTYTKVVIPGKIMEYLATGNSILMIGDPDSDAAVLLKDYDSTLTVREGDSENAAIFIKTVYSEWLSVDGKKSNKGDLSKLTRKQKTQEVANLIRAIVD